MNENCAETSRRITTIAGCKGGVGEEVKRLQSKLSRVHEKQELLMSKMSSILGGHRKVTQDGAGGLRRSSVDDPEIEELENIIFIGRNRG